MNIQGTMKIKAPIEHVFKCLTDIEYYKIELNRISKNGHVKIQHDKNNPFSKNNTISCSVNGYDFKFSIVENDFPHRLVMTCINNQKGRPPLTINYLAQLHQITPNKTKCIFAYDLSSPLLEQSKPLKFTIRIILFIFSFSMQRLFKKYVHAKNT